MNNNRVEEEVKDVVFTFFVQYDVSTQEAAEIRDNELLESGEEAPGEPYNAQDLFHTALNQVILESDVGEDIERVYVNTNDGIRRLSRAE